MDRNNDDAAEKVRFTESILEKMDYYFEFRLDQNQFLYDRDRLSNDILLRIRKEFYGEKKVHIEDISNSFSYPATWWQAFKDANFPKWLLRRYPVKKKLITKSSKVTIERAFLYPSIPVNGHNHIVFEQILRDCEGKEI